MSLRASTIMKRIKERIEALDATPWRLGGIEDVWHEALTPFGPSEEGDASQHLAFIATVDSLQPFNRDSTWEEQTDEYQARLSVVFAFALDPAAQMTSVRLAADAAAQIVDAVDRFQDWASDDIAAVDVVQAFDPSFEPGGRFMRVYTGFDIRYDRSAR